MGHKCCFRCTHAVLRCCASREVSASEQPKLSGGVQQATSSCPDCETAGSWLQAQGPLSSAEARCHGSQARR